MGGELAGVIEAQAGYAPLAADLGANLILLGVLGVVFLGIVVGFFTYGGSGIAHRPVDVPGPPGARRPDDFTAFASRQPLPRDLDEIAPGLWRLGGFPPNAFNVYLIKASEAGAAGSDDERANGASLILVDAGTRYSAKRILRGLHGIPLAALMLTHGHPDHQGAGAPVCQLRDIPLWCGAGDADAVESGQIDALVRDRGRNRRLARFLAGPAHPVERRLREGDRVGEFVVLETPGVSPGHISLWREADRVLIAGDVAANEHPVLGRPGLHGRPSRFAADPARTRASLLRLAQLDPEVVVFGHGPPLRDPAALAGLAASVRGVS